MAINGLSLPAGFPTLASQTYTQVLQEADALGGAFGTQDGKVSQQELQLLGSQYASMRFIQFDPAFAQKQQALDVLQSNFGIFANNRGLHPNQPRTMQFIQGEDDHIRPNEIYGVGSRDGNSLNVSQYDVTGQGFPGFPGFPQQPGLGSIFQIYQQLLLLFQQFFGLGF